jgi:hypothetical protein
MTRDDPIICAWSVVAVVILVLLRRFPSSHRFLLLSTVLLRVELFVNNIMKSDIALSKAIHPLLSLLVEGAIGRGVYVHTSMYAVESSNPAACF